MKHIKARPQVDIHKIVIFGAGRIGRSFIGQLFGCNGYKVTFIDIDQSVVDLLNRDGKYRVVIKGEHEFEIIVPGVTAIHALDKESVTDAITSAGIMAISVGKNSLEKVIPVIAAGLLKRWENDPDKPLDIIIAENMLSADVFIRDQLTKILPGCFPLNDYTGLIETSIGRMVPIIPLKELEKDPLVVFAEPYNTLILDRKGFKNAIPLIKELAPKNNIKAWVDRKAFIHNLGHASAAYYGFSLFPDTVYMFEILEHEEVSRFTRDVMIQSADILSRVYPDDFTAEDLKEHINDLIYRFRNRALKDTIFRVGQDLPRKLSINDRFMGVIHLAMQRNMPYDMILRAMSYGFSFKARDESGNYFPEDSKFLSSAKEDLQTTLTGQLGLDPVLDLPVINKLKVLIKKVNVI